MRLRSSPSEGGRQVAKDKADDEAFRLECLEVSRVRERTYLGRRAKLRDEVLGAYGRMCACCGEVGRRFWRLTTTTTEPSTDELYARTFTHG